MRQACTVCGATTANGRRCPTHSGKHNGRSPERDRVAQGHFRQALITRAGHQCEAIGNDGHRCPTTTDLRACHVTPLRDGGTYHPSNGILLCRHHDRAVDAYAR